MENAEKQLQFKFFCGEISVFRLPTLPFPPKLLSQFYSNSRAGSEKGTGVLVAGWGLRARGPAREEQPAFFVTSCTLRYMGVHRVHPGTARREQSVFFVTSCSTSYRTCTEVKKEHGDWGYMEDGGTQGSSRYVKRRTVCMPVFFVTIFTEV